MKNEDKQEIKKRFVEKLQLTGISQNQAAKQINVSAALISNLINEKWDLISEAAWLLFANFVSWHTDRWQIRESRNLKVILDSCNDARENNRLLAVSGFTGAGKTTALKYYSNQTPNTYYVLCTVVMGRKDFLTAIQRALGIETEGSIYNRVADIVDRLAKDNLPLLILDDAGKLNDVNLRLIQVIYDQLEFRAGIMLSGTEYMRNYIVKMANKDKMGFKELRRRIAYWQKLFRPTFSFVRNVCDDYGISDEHAINFIYREAGGNYGSLREMISNALRAAGERGSVSVDMLAGLSVGAKHWES